MMLAIKDGEAVREALILLLMASMPSWVNEAVDIRACAEKALEEFRDVPVTEQSAQNLVKRFREIVFKGEV